MKDNGDGTFSLEREGVFTVGCGYKGPNLNHESWKVAVAAWNNVTPDLIEKSGEKMAVGSREGWERVFEAVSELALRDVAAKLDRTTKALETADSAFRAQMDLNGYKYADTELEHIITSALENKGKLE